MGKAFFLIAYGMAWGYVIHAKEIDKKVGYLIQDGWESLVRNTTRIQAEELNRQQPIVLGVTPGTARAAG